MRLFGAHVGRSVLIRPTVKVTCPWKVSIGDWSWVGDEVVLYSIGEIEIGSNTVISQRSYLCTAGHDYTKPSFDTYLKKIVIEDEVWIATETFVAPGVTVGKGAVIGARSSVFSDIPPGMLCYGNPAKPVKHRMKAEMRIP